MEIKTCEQYILKLLSNTQKELDNKTQLFETKIDGLNVKIKELQLQLDIKVNTLNTLEDMIRNNKSYHELIEYLLKK